jgi:hypothetical protein
MINKTSIWIICFIFALAWYFTDNFIDSIGYTATIYAAGWWLFDKWLWKVCPTRFGRYNISGKWLGTIHYEWQSKKKSKSAQVAIQQTFSNIKIKIETDENASKSIVSQWRFDDEKLFYIYTTDPHSKTKTKNPMQYGGTQIIIKDSRHVRIEYWTDAQTKGYIDLTRKTAD